MAKNMYGAYFLFFKPRRNERESGRMCVCVCVCVCVCGKGRKGKRKNGLCVFSRKVVLMDIVAFM